MQINPAKLHNSSQLMSDYRNQTGDVMDFFDYRPFGDYAERITDLKKRTFDRKALSDVLRKMNQNWGAPASTLHNIERLQEQASTVVIGGQQAGLLTGPLYTINKVISIIQFARQKEEELQIPVIPVFWIAGEDHDFEEINHVYMPEEQQLQKFKLNTAAHNKISVSELPIDHQLIRNWIDEIFKSLQETEYTEGLYDTVLSSLTHSSSYTDFFARLIFRLFEEEGIVLIDSAHEDTRALEKQCFIELIEKQPEISEGVYAAVKKLEKSGYSISLEANQNDGHLFYRYKDERVLLIRDEEGNWSGKQGEITLSQNELIQTAKDNPQLLSNNVVTRPLMQEYLFPTLAFIGGPGEIAYWAALHPAFHAVGLKMPPVMPRLSITYVNRQTEKSAQRFNLSPEQLINEGIDPFKEKWLQSKTSPPISELANELKQTVDDAHKPLRELASEIRSDIADLADKNLFYLYKEIDFLQRKMEHAVEEKYDQQLAALNYLGMMLYPGGGLQERMWNPLPWINYCGTDWIKKVTNQSLSFAEKHYVVYV